MSFSPVVWRKLHGPVIASSAVTTGLFVLAGVVVGGFVTGGVNYALERRRESTSARVALRLLEVELMIAAADADSAFEGGTWSAWNFERAHRSWEEHRGEAARVLPAHDWIKMSVGFYGIDAVQRSFRDVPTGAEVDPTGLALLQETSRSLYEGANTLRRHLGMDEIRSSPPAIAAPPAPAPRP